MKPLMGSGGSFVKLEAKPAARPCSHLTERGLACKRNVLMGYRYCFMHAQFTYLRRRARALKD